jgi:hypothetical protein
MVDLAATLVHTLVVVVLCAAAFYAGACMSDRCHRIAAERQSSFVLDANRPPAVAPNSASVLPDKFEKQFKETGRATCRLR